MFAKYLYKIIWDGGEISLSRKEVSSQCLRCKNIVTCLKKIQLKKYKHIPISKWETLIWNQNCVRFPCDDKIEFFPSIIDGIGSGYNKPDKEIDDELNELIRKRCEYSAYEDRRLGCEKFQRSEQEKHLTELNNERQSHHHYSGHSCQDFKEKDPGFSCRHIMENSWISVYEIISHIEQKNEIDRFTQEQERFYSGEDI